MKSGRRNSSRTPLLIKKIRSDVKVVSKVKRIEIRPRGKVKVRSTPGFRKEDTGSPTILDSEMVLRLWLSGTGVEGGGDPTNVVTECVNYKTKRSEEKRKQGTPE